MWQLVWVIPVILKKPLIPWKSPKKNGAKTIAITHSLRSPITEYADLVLVNGNKQGKLQGDSIGTKIAQLFVLDLIYALLVQASQESAVKIKQKNIKCHFRTTYQIGERNSVTLKGIF